MKTPLIVGKYRLGIIRRLINGDPKTEKAVSLQKMTDAEIMRMIYKEEEK